MSVSDDQVPTNDQELHDALMLLVADKRLNVGTAALIYAAALRLQLLQKFKAAILDIDAHATPLGEDDEGFVAIGYAISVGSLHRALGLVGHSSARCANLPCPRAAKLMEASADWEAIRQTVDCPECEGTQLMAATTPSGGNTNWDCEDCTDGKIDMARLLAVGAAAFSKPTTSGGNPYDPDDTSYIYADGYNTALYELRVVRP